MKKNLQNMERLCEKMQARFGEDDDLVLQFRRELAILREKKQKNAGLANFGRRSVDKANASHALN
jgi:hypothetical protein